jgi:thiol-disulfide isomerase/thioredoxin
MLLIAHGSRHVASRFRENAQRVRIAGGVLMAAAALVIYEGWAEGLQTKLPPWAKWAQDAIEGNSTAKDKLERLGGKRKPVFVSHEQRLASRLGRLPLKDYGPVPEVAGISHWLNSPPLKLHALRGKVVLVDFWTYSCINCLRTLPYLKKWDERYRSQGLVILGVHSPEFAFEHDVGNVRSAVKRLGVRYPVALDNGFDTWQAYDNQYWPADYLVDQRGNVREIHIGEGDYDETEDHIRLLLEAGGRSELAADVHDPDRTPRERRTPESYLGYERIDGYRGSPLETDRSARYRFPPTLALDTFAYAGTWTVQNERIVAGKDARLRLHFRARSVHLVLTGRGVVRVKLNGVEREAVRVTGDRLYTLVTQPRAAEGLLELAFTPGLAAYAFTFG